MSDRINERTNCSQTGQDCPDTFIERAHSRYRLHVLVGHAVVTTTVRLRFDDRSTKVNKVRLRRRNTLPAVTLAAVRLTYYIQYLAGSTYGRNECRRMVVARSNCMQSNRSITAVDESWL